MNQSFRSTKFLSDKRGAAEVAAIALLIGIVVLGVSAILLTAGPQLNDGQDRAEISQAEQALTQFDSDAARVATGSTAGQTTALGLQGTDGTLDARPESGTITVTYIDAPPSVDDGQGQTVMNESLGAVVYQNDETEVAYQGGGVWRKDENGSVMVSPPEIAFQDKTLTMHIIRSDSAGSIHSTVQVDQAAQSTQQYPNATADEDLVNRVNESIIQVSVQSRYYKAWGQYFEGEANTVVQYNDAQNRVTVLFVALPVDYSPNAGVVATSGPGEIRLEGTGAYIDSYNSTEGPYELSNSTDGKVQAAGDVVTKGDAEIDGETQSGRNISVEGGSRLDGDAYANGTIEVDGTSTVTGTQYENEDRVPNIPPINQLVEDRTEEVADTNDNNETEIIEDDQLDIEGEQGTLDSGEYYTESLHLQGETLVLNTTDGDITIAVRDSMVLEKNGGDNSHIKVQGNGDVRVFLKSEQKADVSVPGGGGASTSIDEVHFFVERNGTISVPDDRSNRFMIFGPDHFVGAIGGSNAENADVVSTIVAPAGPAGEGQFYVQQGEIYGAIMTGNLTLGQYGQVHFDRALLEKEIPLAPNVPRLEYLYLMEHKLKVESA